MQLSLMSPSFLGLSLAAAVLLAILAGAGRQVAFLVANVVFLWPLLLGPQGVISTIAFCLLGYLLTRLILWQPGWGFGGSLIAYVLLFVYMRNYDFLHWLLPEGVLTAGLSTVGLSFLFFKIVHVMIEAQSRTLGSLEFLTYLNYCLNFTTFMMGPIQRYQDFSAQWYGRDQAIPLRFEAYLDAVLRILMGLVKAYVLAEWLKPFTLPENSDLLSLPLSSLLVGVYAFYFFLYLNFAGYCDVAIGIGSLLGVRPPENFDMPFLARNISDFWFRFHRSLTLWLTDYIFSPAYKWALMQRWFASQPLLAMNAALILTLIASGLWHGTTLNFFLFGLIHGTYFVIFRTWETLVMQRFGRAWLREWRKRWSVQLAGMVITFNAVAFSLVFFHLDTTRALQVFARLLGGL